MLLNIFFHQDDGADLKDPSFIISNFVCDLPMVFKKGDLFAGFYSMHWTGLHM